MMFPMQPFFTSTLLDHSKKKKKSRRNVCLIIHNYGRQLALWFYWEKEVRHWTFFIIIIIITTCLFVNMKFTSFKNS